MVIQRHDISSKLVLININSLFLNYYSYFVPFFVLKENNDLTGKGQWLFEFLL